MIALTILTLMSAIMFTAIHTVEMTMIDNPPRVSDLEGASCRAILWDRSSQSVAPSLLIRSVNTLAEKAFERVWDNPEDEVYDRL
jgi:hypothetical protein